MAVIGIDLGTTNTIASCWKNGKSIIISNTSGELSVPSAVSINDDGTVLIGKIAEERLISHPECSVSEFKREIGSEKKYDLNGKVYSSVELSALVLKKIKENAESFLGESIEEAVISVPAYFDDKSRNATKAAAQLAGLNVKRLVNEPSAAALAYIHQNNFEDGTYLILDLGGGTLDVSVVDTFDGVVEILAVAGDNRLGGKDFNDAIVRFFCDENKLSYDDLDPVSKAVLYRNAENCKKALSDVQSAIMIANINEKQYSSVIDNNTLIRISSDLLDRIAVPVKKVLHDSRCRHENLTDIILIGGSSKMPVIKAFAEKLFSRKVCCDIDPDIAVASGAGLFAGIRNNEKDLEDIVLTDICPFSIGIAAFNKEANEDLMEFIIYRNTTLPASRMKKFCALSDNQKKIRIKVYQGESMLPAKNSLIGELEVECPETSRGDEICEVRLTYDINGILMIDVTTIADNVNHNKTIINMNNTFTDEELAEIIKKMNASKLSLENDEENALLIARAERMFEEALPVERQLIQKSLIIFKSSLKSMNNHDIRLAFNNLEKLLDSIGGLY